MSQTETEKFGLSITRGEYDALDAIRGLEASVHLMVMCARRQENGRFVLEGSQSAFDALQSDLSDEIYHELSPPSRIKQLRKLYQRLSPDSDL